MDEELQEFITKQKEVILSSYEQAKNYSNIIIMSGYVGLFTIWNFTRDDLESWQSIMVGLLMLISILIFVIFELYGIWFRSTQTFNLLSELQRAEKLDQFPNDYGKQEMKRLEYLSKIWPFFFFSAIVSALLASSILIFSFVKQIL